MGDDMTKILLLFSFIFIQSFAQANWMLQTMPPWEKISEVTETALTKKEFLELHEKYPDFFQGYDGSTVTTAFVTTTTWFYKGKTKCKKEDSRLTQQTFYYGLCEEQDNSALCFSRASSLSSEDPCGK